MDNIVWVIVLLLSIFSTSFVLASHSLSSKQKFVLSIYLLSYLLTTVIGATLIALPATHEFSIDSLRFVNIQWLEINFDYKYWGLLYAPFILVPWFVYAFNRFIPINKTKLTITIPNIDLLIFWLSFAVIILFIIIRFAQHHAFTQFCDYINELRNSDQAPGPLYMLSITNRYNLFHQLTIADFGILYSSVPFFLYLAIFNAVKNKSMLWLISGSIIFIIYSTLILITFQKTLIIITLIVASIGALILLRNIKINLLLSFILILILILFNQYEHMVSNSWDLINTIQLFIFRVSSAFPFYYLLYPGIIPFTGPEIFRSLLGFNSHYPADSTTVYNFMYPITATPVQGYVVTSAHMIGYAQGGYLMLAVVLFAIAVVIKLSEYISDNIDNPFGFVLYLYCLTMMYYLTQISLISTVISSYGIIWSLPPLILILTITFLVKNFKLMLK